MNKKSLFNKASFKSSLDKKTGKAVFERAFEIIAQNVKKREPVEIEGLGKFEVVHRKMKKAVNNKRRAEMLLPPKDKIVFTPSPELLMKLNKNE
jgi:nucleoid DNA-binding protein